MNLSEEQLDSIIDRALAEDISRGDITSEALLPPGLQGKAVIRVKAKGVLAGGEVARRVFLRVDPSLKIEIIIKDGARVKPGDMLATISGTVMSILKAERVALNFLQRLSGIATETAQFVAGAQGLPITILDTRKTTPGLRLLEKYAVRTGGGQNHRLDLSDGILIKDTHLAALRALGMNLPDIITRAKRNAPHHLKVEIEVSTVEEAVEAAAAGADIIMLDNMSPEEMRRAASLAPAGVKLEASGGITLKNIGAAARSGVDFISIGALTHSPRALDMSLTIQ
ncbi:MAG: carboxylating nicotinate-nucleotide diphosphorylase [Chloroflexota bacterium]|nr:carboxylating nicotinate-nucleotide diphosphorylase [Chloroflexota bacterium]